MQASLRLREDEVTLLLLHCEFSLLVYRQDCAEETDYHNLLLATKIAIQIDKISNASKRLAYLQAVERNLVLCPKNPRWDYLVGMMKIHTQQLNEIPRRIFNKAVDKVS